MGKKHGKPKAKKTSISNDYNVGSLGDIIAQSCGVETPEFDPVLASLFSNSNQNKTVVKKTINQPLPPAPIVKTTGIKSKQNKQEERIIETKRTPPIPKQPPQQIRLSNKEAANIRVSAKAKFSRTGAENDVDDDANGEDDDDVAGTENESMDVTTTTTTANSNSKKSKSPGEIKKSLEELNAPKEKNAELESRTVYVGNVPKSATKQKLLKLFKKLGPVETIRLRCAAPDKPTRLKKVAMNKKELHPDSKSVTAYVRFKTREDAEAVIEKSKGLILDEHHLTLDMADNSLKRDNKKAIFVGNLPLRADDNSIYSLFEDCGVIDSVRVIRDRATGMGKGFCYVNFADKASVEIALKKDGTELDNRALRISRCVKKLKKTQAEKEKLQLQQQGINPKGKMGGNKLNKSAGTERVTDNKNKNKKSSFVSQGKRQRKEAFSGDQTAEIGKFKRNSKKPNRDELKKARIAKQLLPRPAFVPSTTADPKVPQAVKDYKTKKKELRKLNKPRWPRENKTNKSKS